MPVDTMAATAVPSPTRPLTGAEYLESLRDGREIWLYGERVEDVTTHPAFRNTARMIARLYDALHDPALQEVLTIATDTGSGGYNHR
jgi:aromatic ring hydroxylase